MAWETRKHSQKQYYTRSRRSDGQMQREYLGCGERARRSAEHDKVARQAQAFLRQQLAQQRQQRHERQTAIYATILAPLDGLDILCRVAMQRELEAAGYHQHDRGAWRKRRK